MIITTSTFSPLGIVVFDIDGVIRDVTGSHFRAMSDRVEYFTEGYCRPTQENIDNLLAEGNWNNDYQASQELIFRYYESQGKSRDKVVFDYQSLVNFFEQRYWGNNLSNNFGYIDEELLLVKRSYFDQLNQAGILWGFFTGATRHSANYVLEKRLGLTVPALFTVEDGPGKPEPIGLLEVVRQLEILNRIEKPLPVIFAGDTVADQETINRAKKLDLNRNWIGVGILPPHVQKVHEKTQSYKETLIQAGAKEIFLSIEDLNLERILFWFKNDRFL